MKRYLLYIFLLGLGLTLTLVGRHWLVQATAPPPMPEHPQRIVSLAPSVTETLFALGLGDRVVGVTRFCDYPEAARKLPKVAGFSDVNYEAVVQREPDLVAMPADKVYSMTNLTHLGFNTLAVDTSTIDKLLSSIMILGKATGQGEEAATIVARLTNAMDKARVRAQGQPRPKVLFSVMHNADQVGYISEINAVGDDGFFNSLIEMAGGENIYKGSLSFPRLSREAILFLNPEVIIDVVPNVDDLEEARRSWASLSTVKAIKNGRLILITDKSTTVPGPRLDKTLETLSQAFHPASSEDSASSKVPGNSEAPERL